MNKKTVADIDVEDKRVLVRVDFNLPTDPKTGDISDDSRIRAALPTLEYLLDRGGRLVLCSHLGRPKGKVVDSLRMAPVGECLAQLIAREVSTSSCCIGRDVKSQDRKLEPRRDTTSGESSVSFRRGEQRFRLRPGAGFPRRNLRQ